MRHGSRRRGSLGLLLALVALGSPVVEERAEAGAPEPFEVWAIDQSNSPGFGFGGLLSIYDGDDLTRKPRTAVPEVVDLAGSASELCREETGSNPVRPHSVMFNQGDSHAVIAFVASGHVLFMEAVSRTPVECIRMSAGATHGMLVAP